MGKPSDPEVYATAIVTLLAQYPEGVVMKVCDPILGLPRSCKFLPSIAELSEALGKEMQNVIRPIRDEIDRQQKRIEEEECKHNRPTPEQRARIGKMMSDLSQKLRAAS